VRKGEMMAEKSVRSLSFDDEAPRLSEEKAKSGEQWEVTLKKNHPTGSYQRAGLTFSALHPRLIDGPLPAAIEKEVSAAYGWLIAKKVA
jgi:hypothetical protein